MAQPVTRQRVSDTGSSFSPLQNLRHRHSSGSVEELLGKHLTLHTYNGSRGEVSTRGCKPPSNHCNTNTVIIHARDIQVILPRSSASEAEFARFLADFPNSPREYSTGSQRMVPVELCLTCRREKGRKPSAGRDRVRHE
jgi:hypothetical protein